jgi:hypothetical protein
MEIETLYNVQGRPVAYVFQGEYVYLYDGKPVAFFRDEHLYGFNGRYLGWLQNGWIFDRRGQRVFFTREATGGPARPARHARPARGARQARPARSARQARPARPACSLAWSPSSDESFFVA